MVPPFAAFSSQRAFCSALLELMPVGLSRNSTPCTTTARNASLGGLGQTRYS